MKSKRFLCTVLACVVMISCITNAAAIQEEVADDFVEYNTESILTTRAIGEFEMTVSAILIRGVNFLQQRHLFSQVTLLYCDKRFYCEY